MKDSKENVSGNEANYCRNENCLLSPEGKRVFKL